MFRSLKSRAAVLALTAAVGVGVAGIASPAGAAANPATTLKSIEKNIELCLNGGWQHWQRADHTAFQGPVVCVLYAALGGVLVAPKTASQILCESYGGTFGHTDLTGNDFTSILWSCNGYPITTTPDYSAKFDALFNDCRADGVSEAAAVAPSTPGLADFTCGQFAT